MPGVDRTGSEPWAPDLRRSIALFREFRFEQPDPARFYGALARDSVQQLRQYADLVGATVLDVGGGPGYFEEAFGAAGATYVSVDADAGELAGRGQPPRLTVMGSGLSLPIKDRSVDVCYSSNVLEHVPEPWQMAEEMVRVTRRGGVVFLSYTTWFGPWGGHETAPWHYLGGRRARAVYRRRFGHEPKNKYGESLFRVTVKDGLRWAREQTVADLVEAFPRYHPRWAWKLTSMPGLRELATWNLVIVLRPR